MEEAGTLEARLRAVEVRFDEVETRLAQMGAEAFDPDENKRLSKERSSLEPLVSSWREHRASRRQRGEAEQMARDSDPEIAEMARGEIQRLRAQVADSEGRLKELLVPKDPDDDKDIFIEIRAGTGGDEASLFAADLMRMYL